MGRGCEGEPGASVGGKVPPGRWGRKGGGLTQLPRVGVQPAVNEGLGGSGHESSRQGRRRREVRSGHLDAWGAAGHRVPTAAGCQPPSAHPGGGAQPRRQKVVEMQAEGSDLLQAALLPSCFLTKVGTQNTTRFPKSRTALGTARTCVSASCCVATPPSGRPRDGATDPQASSRENVHTKSH